MDMNSMPEDSVKGQLPKPPCSKSNVLASNTSPTINQRSRMMHFIGQMLAFMTVISFMFAGLLINIVQFVLYNTLNRFNGRLYKRINRHLFYAVYSPILAITYYWARAKLNIRLADPELAQDAHKPMISFFLFNHSNELDWLLCLMMGDQLGNRGYKTISKSELAYVPIIGWSCRMSHIIFVKRDWRHDQIRLRSGLNKIFDSRQTFVALFCEGTRYTESKYEASVEYARKHGITPLKHHLLPRPRGFSACVKHVFRMKEDLDYRKSQVSLPDSDFDRPFRVFNVQTVVPSKPTFKSIFRGVSFTADVYVEEIKLDKDSDENQLNQTVYDVYRRKDEIVDNYNAMGGKFDGHIYPFQHRLWPLINWLIGFIITYGTLLYVAMDSMSSIKFWIGISTVVLSAILMWRRLDAESTSEKHMTEGR